MNDTLKQMLVRILSWWEGLIWAAIGGLGPALMDLYDDLHNYSDPVDWGHLEKLAMSGGGMAIVAYILKQRALFTQVPQPVLEQTALDRSVDTPPAGK